LPGVTRIRFAAFIAALVLLVSAPAALAQSNPFDGLPPAQPTPAPTVEPVDNNATDNVGRDTLYLIGGALLAAFIGIGVWISRDARSNLPADERDQLDGRKTELAHKHERQAKAKARAKGRAQRQARKAHRKKARR
jgi:hypothetical protein